ncbi:relaxase/mobilization nuclease domain-containing protein [Pedobacter sp. Leaf194]|uniref:relaxase/mobilization nuclease domain-containing protein n=1 Tax=Pedobacter sp. Leaf194 TaxID=1736297 RepID=UPI0007026C67|nr:relaxase/mobilization nuclease domain-containing protein [Pedobacter sp. Leaf194]KQS36861.1 hypothetical protein ASG14_07435 [Pedobacter sp. Leaf194]
MVARIVSGKSIRGMLSYNEQKVSEGNATILLASGFATDIENLNLFQKIGRFNQLTKLNTRSKTNAMHISLSFHKDDKLDNERFQQIAAEYMERIGLGDQPFIAYRHFDTDHPHLHIATTSIRRNGERVKTQSIGSSLSEPARIELEKKYNLVQAKGRSLKNDPYLRVAEYGSKPTKRQIANITQSVVRDYTFTSFQEYKAVLSLFKVLANRGEENTQMFKNNGLLYSIMDNNGNPVGVPIKASSIYKGVTIQALEKCYDLNKEKRKTKKDDLKRRIDNVIQKYHLISTKTFQNELAAEQIALIYRRNNEGLLYGLTFVDHKNLTVFNGSALGKEYSAASISHMISGQDELKTYLKKPLSMNISLQAERSSAPLNATILESLSIKDEPDPIMKTHRKRKKKKGKNPTQNLGL